jgi:hypothetical protein
MKERIASWGVNEWCLIVLTALALWWVFGAGGAHPSVDFDDVKNARWQAVFLTNDQVYFGKLENTSGAYVKLTNVYYLRSASDITRSDGDGKSINLVKLGGELHGPEDVMYIAKDKILFWENLKESARIVTLISTMKQ